MEFYFMVVEADEINNTEITCFSGLKTLAMLPREERRVVLRAILHATRLLLGQVNPAIVNWCTWDENPPRKALDKHLLIAKVFEVCGYEVGTSDAYHGHHVWWAERKVRPGFPFEGGNDDEARRTD